LHIPNFVAIIVAMDRKLTEKQQRFIEAYILEPNATKAALAAGYAPANAGAMGHENLNKPEIEAALAAARAAACVRNNVTVDRVLEGLARIAFADIRDVFGENGALLPVDQWSDDVAHTISSLEVTELKSEGVAYGVLSKVKQSDRMVAFKMLGQYLEIFTENIKHSGEIARPIALRPGDIQAAAKALADDY
jgi:phage terminase small subunit